MKKKTKKVTTKKKQTAKKSRQRESEPFFYTVDEVVELRGGCLVVEADLHKKITKNNILVTFNGEDVTWAIEEYSLLDIVTWAEEYRKDEKSFL